MIRKTARYILWGVIGTIALLYTFLFFVPVFLSQEDIKAKLQEIVKEGTGYDIEISRDVILSFFPDFSVSVFKAHLRKGEDLRDIRRFRLGVNPLYLFINKFNSSLSFETNGREHEIDIDFNNLYSVFFRDEFKTDAKIYLLLPVKILVGGEIISDKTKISFNNFRLQTKGNDIALHGSFNKDTNIANGKISSGRVDIEDTLRTAYVLTEKINYYEGKNNRWYSEKPNLFAKELNISFALNNSRFLADAKIADFYEGKISGMAEVVRGEGDFNIRRDIEIEGINLGKLVKEIWDIDRIDAKADMNLALYTKGSDTKEIIENLNGEGAIAIKDGLIKGVDFMSMTLPEDNIMQKALNSEVETEIKSLTASFEVVDGVLHNDNLVLKVPFLDVLGEGEINLYKRILKYRLTPIIGAGKVGLQFPLILEGKLEKPDVKPDVKKIVTQNLDEVIKQKAGELKEATKDMEKSVREAISSKKKLRETLDGLLKGLDDLIEAAPIPDK